jgi:hypothetical protein
MPSYDFICNKCNEKWEAFLSISQRNKPIEEPCPHCSCDKCVEKNWQDTSLSIGSDATLTPNKATGGRWNDLMQKMKAGLPPRYRKKLDSPNNMTGRSWKG